MLFFFHRFASIPGIKSSKMRTAANRMKAKATARKFSPSSVFAFKTRPITVSNKTHAEVNIANWIPFIPLMMISPRKKPLRWGF